MKTGFYPMKVKLKLFFKWGIEFEEKYEVAENSNREVHYANRSELFNNIIQTYCPHYLEQTECEDIVDADEPTSAQQEEPTKEPENSSVEQNKNKQGKVVVRTERPAQGDNSNE